MTRISAIAGIQRRYLHDEVADRLRELILSGELEPKARVNELELCERFGTSRTPLREAIKILSSEGLVELLPNRGARVATLNAAEIDDMVQVVAGLEATAAELACQRATPEEIDEIARQTDAMMLSWKAEDENGYLTTNRAIHEAIMKASRNGALQAIYLSLSSRIQRMRYTAHKTPEQWRRAMDEHVLMVTHLRARDGVKLAQVMKDHIRGKAEVIAANYGAED
ncbi:MAG: GntR family transcriptional regulator [Beijerinckiaceae bacterium]